MDPVNHTRERYQDSGHKSKAAVSLDPLQKKRNLSHDYVIMLGDYGVRELKLVQKLVHSKQTILLGMYLCPEEAVWTGW